MKIRGLLLVFLLITSAAQAALNINVTGVIGSGQTTWSFGGSYQTAPADFLDEVRGRFSFSGGQRGDPGVNGFLHGSGQLSGELTSNANFDLGFVGFLTSKAVIRGSSTGSHIIDGLFLDSDGAVGGDDFGWLADGTFSIIPETLTFGGSAILEADISQFGEGATAITSLGDSFRISSTSGVTPLGMTFIAVPEPSTYAPILGLVGLGFAVWRRRRPSAWS